MLFLFRRLKINKVRPYIKDIINILKKSDTWKIQLMVTISFISSTDDNDEDSETHSKSGNTEIMMNDKANEIIEEIFESLKNIYQNKLDESMKGSEFIVFEMS